VTKPFPYSILYYTDDIPDHGKALRSVVSDFERNYDAELYSLPNFVDRILGPIQLHQGTADEAVPQKWSDDFVKLLKEKGRDVTYYIYPGADHNMAGSPTGGWNTVVARDIDFFGKHLK
jgi:dipeptidyl aminopeptidase/acylaminoacyl peptidase